MTKPIVDIETCSNVILLIYIHTYVISVKPRTEVEECFRILRDNAKWTLTTLKTIEDSLYAFGKLKIVNHPSQSLIFDIDYSDSYIENGVFIEKEIKEITKISYTKICLAILNSI